MKWIKENFHFLVIVGILILILPLGYYYLYALPALNRDKLNFDKEKYVEGIRIEAAEIEEKKLLDDQKLNLEKEKLELQKNDRVVEETKANNLKINLGGCLSKVNIMISAVFDSEIEVKLKECQEIIDYININKVNMSSYQLEDEVGRLRSCRYLLEGIMGQKEKVKQEENDECYKKYPQS